MDISGKQYSHEPLTKARAEKQLTALHIHTGHGFGGMMRVSNPLVPQVTPEQEARAVIQRILNSANSARSTSITIDKGHNSMEKIMNESALELFKAGKAGAVKYLNELRAPYESREDYKKDDSTERNKVAKEMGLEIKYGGRKRKYRGAGYDQLKTLRIVAGNAGTTVGKMRATIVAQGYGPIFNAANANPDGNDNAFLGRANQVRVLNLTYLIAQQEMNMGLLTPEQAAEMTFVQQPNAQAIQDFVQEWKNLHPDQNGQGKYYGRFSEPDTHILIGNELVGGDLFGDVTQYLTDHWDEIAEFIFDNQQILRFLAQHFGNQVYGIGRRIAEWLMGTQHQHGDGKHKFVKKYLKGQGLPATKKNIAKICNIMDVEGIVFE
jgi:hypothetical protein